VKKILISKGSLIFSHCYPSSKDKNGWKLMYVAAKIDTNYCMSLHFPTLKNLQMKDEEEMGHHMLQPNK